MRTFKCAVCGGEFTPKTRQSKYCSDACRKIASDAQKKRWYKEHKENRRDILEERKERLAAEKRRRIDMSVKLAIEMGLRSPD